MRSDSSMTGIRVRSPRGRGQTVAAAVALAIVTGAGPVAMAADDSDVDEVLVTAQRRSQSVMEVPLSVAAYTPEKMDQQGIRAIEDLARLTPSLRFSRTSGVSGNNGSDISIRNIASDVGSATTAIYIDDTPIQVRSIGYFGGNTFPLVFDLERIEVLRGPQGTLFGAGAQGGAVRFITPTATVGQSSLYARSEVGSIRNGGTTYEAGVGGGASLGSAVAVRGSVWYRREGGFIDRFNPTFTTKLGEDINSSDSYSGRVALGWQVTDALVVTPSVYYQRVDSNGRNQYWEAQSNVADQDYRTGIFNLEPSLDEFTLPALKIEYDFGGVDLISNTSLFDRTRTQDLDYATFLSSLRAGNPFGTYGNRDPLNAVASQRVEQSNFVQEVRLQSASDSQRLDWVAGVFYTDANQTMQNLSGSGRIPGVISSGFPQYLGRYNLFDLIDATDEQLAGFASLDYKVTNRVTTTVGARLVNNRFEFVQTRNGPVNGGRQTIDTAKQDDTAFTPKLGVTFKVDEDNMLYASVSKGFRPGGAQGPVDPSFCAADLATLGLSASPRDYGSDSLWSYEVGSKNTLMGGALMVDVNLYVNQWDNIQQSVRLPRCSFAFIANLGKATGHGADLQLSVRPTGGLELGANVSYNKTEYDDAVRGGNGLLLRGEGDRIGGPSWTGAVYGLGERQLRESVDGYLRFDFTFQGSGIPQNPAAFGFDPGLSTLPSVDTLSLRAGIRYGSLDLSLFANNVTDANEPLARAHDAVTSPLYYAQTYQPRTIGLTAVLRY